MEVDPMTVARSVVAGFLLKRFEDRGIFIPINNREISYHLNEDRLLSASEKLALKNLGLRVNSDSDSYSGCMDDDKEYIILGISSAIRSIERETGGLNCGDSGHMNGKHVFYVMGIELEKLSQELVPPSLSLQDLTLAPEDVSDFVKHEQRAQRAIKVRRLLHEN